MTSKHWAGIAAFVAAVAALVAHLLSGVGTIPGIS
jgi:hypothetical protein